MNMNYSNLRTERDSQHSGLWAHMAARRGHEILQTHGYNYRRNDPSLYHFHCAEAYISDAHNKQMELKYPQWNDIEWEKL